MVWFVGWRLKLQVVEKKKEVWGGRFEGCEVVVTQGCQEPKATTTSE